MELLQLRYFRSAAQLENFSKAAEIHMVPQPAISKTIRKLEEELGCTLFTRNGKRITLNDNGKRFLERVDTALQNLDAGIAEIKPQGVTMLRLYIQSGIRFVSDFVSAYEKKYPEHKVIYYQGEPVKILGEQYDFVLTQFPIDETELDYQILMEDELMLAVPSSGKLAKKKEVTLSTLSNQQYITFCEGNQLRSIFEKLCHESGFQPNIIVEAKEASVFRTMIEINAGLALVPASSWNTQKNEHVTLVPLSNHPKRILALAWKKNNLLSSEKKRFVDFVSQWFSQYH